MSSIASRRAVFRRIIRLTCAESADRLIFEVQNTRKKASGFVIGLVNEKN